MDAALVSGWESLCQLLAPAFTQPTMYSRIAIHPTARELWARTLASRQLVEHLLQLLKPVERLVIDLLYLQGRSVEEIHQIIGLGVAAIKVRAFRARQKMKAQLEKIGATP